MNESLAAQLKIWIAIPENRVAVELKGQEIKIDETVFDEENYTGNYCKDSECDGTH